MRNRVPDFSKQMTRVMRQTSNQDVPYGTHALLQTRRGMGFAATALAGTPFPSRHTPNALLYRLQPAPPHPTPSHPGYPCSHLHKTTHVPITPDCFPPPVRTVP